MNIDETLVRETDLDEPYSDSWWRARTTEELRQMMTGGLRMSLAFDGAAAETERRAQERLSAQEAVEHAEADRKRRLRLNILGIFLLAGLLAIVAVLLLR